MVAKTLFVFIILLNAIASVDAAQQTRVQLSGIVRDTTGLPMGGVEVGVSGPSGVTTVLTQDDGRFQFEVIVGSHELSARKSGFRDWNRNVQLVSGAALTVDVELQPGYAETRIVTAARGEESLLGATATVTVIDSQEIETSAADNFADLLRGVPGLNVAQLGARDVNINTRGAAGILANSMLVMVDGRSFFQPFYGAVYWDLLPVTMDEISQIEVLRTPASALWGANALNGVINVLTKSPRQLKGFRGYAGAGQQGTWTAGATWADSTDRLAYKLSGSYFEQDPWERDNLLPDGSPMPPFAVFENKGAKQPKVDVRLDLDGDPRWVWSMRGGLVGANGLQHSALGPAEFSSGSYYSYLEVDHRRDGFEFKAYWNRLDSPFRIVLYGLDEESTADTYVSEASKRMKLGSAHNLTFGGVVRLDRFAVTIAPGDRGRFDTGAFVEDRISLLPRLNAVVGARLEKFDTTDAVFAPRLGLVVSPSDAHSFRVLYNRAYRAPSLLENFVDVPLPALLPTDPPFPYAQLALGSTELDMEKKDAFEVGYTGVLGSRAVVFATVYDQRVENNIWFLPVTFYGPGAPPPGYTGDPSLVPVAPHVFTFVNLGSVRDRGVELAAKVEWPRLSLQATYTYQHMPELESGVAFPLQINLPPRHQGGGGITYATDRWTAAGDVHYTDRAFWSDVFTPEFWGYSDAYVSVNARASYRLRGLPWELWIGATNLLDQEIKSHVFADTVRRKVTAGVSWRFER